MPRINMMQLFFEADGSPMMAGTGTSTKPATLRHFGIQALFHNPRGETLTFEEGARREGLRELITKEDKPEILEADLKLIGDLIAAMFNVPGVFVPAINMITRAESCKVE
jgi:hypothetical protein